MTGPDVDTRTLDRIYVAACSLDTRLARICVASIRYFYPGVPIQILAGDKLPGAFTRELRRHWNIGVADLPAGIYGWGMVKLEPLFGPPGERFLVLDADTVFTGKVLGLREGGEAPFLVNDEQLSDVDLKQLYYDWDRVAERDPEAPPARRAFNTGQWFGTAGLIRREDFDGWLEWTLPRRVRHPDVFKCGDQGLLNYVMLRKETLEGLTIDRRTFMRWPGHTMEGLDVASVAARTAPPLVAHWAGMKTPMLRDMTGGDLLQFFEHQYYRRIPFGRPRRRLEILRHAWLQWSSALARRMRLRLAIWLGPRPRPGSPRIVRETIQS